MGVGYCDVPLGTSSQRFWTQLFIQEYIQLEEPEWTEEEWQAYLEWLEMLDQLEGQE